MIDKREMIKRALIMMIMIIVLITIKAIKINYFGRTLFQEKRIKTN